MYIYICIYTHMYAAIWRSRNARRRARSVPELHTCIHTYVYIHTCMQLYGDQEMHEDVRAVCLNYIAQERDHFCQFITEEFDEVCVYVYMYMFCMYVCMNGCIFVNL
jgi:hypothetical protein